MPASRCVEHRTRPAPERRACPRLLAGQRDLAAPSVATASASPVYPSAGALERGDDVRALPATPLHVGDDLVGQRHRRYLGCGWACVSVRARQDDVQRRTTAAGQDDRALDHVLQLADVRPARMSHRPVPRPRADSAPSLRGQAGTTAVMTHLSSFRERSTARSARAPGGPWLEAGGARTRVSPRTARTSIWTRPSTSIAALPRLARRLQSSPPSRTGVKRADVDARRHPDGYPRVSSGPTPP
jgi:hypothetical protein